MQLAYTSWLNDTIWISSAKASWHASTACDGQRFSSPPTVLPRNRSRSLLYHTRCCKLRPILFSLWWTTAYENPLATHLVNPLFSKNGNFKRTCEIPDVSVTVRCQFSQSVYWSRLYAAGSNVAQNQFSFDQSVAVFYEAHFSTYTATILLRISTGLHISTVKTELPLTDPAWTDLTLQTIFNTLTRANTKAIFYRQCSNGQWEQHMVRCEQVSYNYNIYTVCGKKCMIKIK